MQRGGKAYCRALRRSLTGLCVASQPAQMQTTGLRLAQKRRKEMISGSFCCSFNQARIFRTAGYHWGERSDASFCFSFQCLFLSLLLWYMYLRTWNNQHHQKAALCRLLNKGESQTTTRWPSVFWGQCAAVSTNRRMVTLKLRNSPPFCLINIQLPRVPDEQISEVLRTIGCFGLLEISLRSQYI